MSGSTIGDVRLPLPPLFEQAAIVRFLDRARDNTRAAVTKSRRQIELLCEYRASLIAGVVTGKLDVRGATVRLPEIDRLASDEEPNGCDRTTGLPGAEGAVVGTKAVDGSRARHDGGAVVGREARP